MGIDVPEGYPVEMHKIFRAWFIWGFWSKVYLIVTTILFTSLNKWIGSVSSVLGGISCGLYMTNGLVWLIFGAIWRYSVAGKTAAGDFLERPESMSAEDWESSLDGARKSAGYQFSSGSFIHLYLVLFASFILIIFMIAAVVGFATCATDQMAKNQKKEEEEVEQ
mmetsp:Transcript_45828/g.60715  ORF Transcript_45828/g.60715 Transcript_45828/m.60715 type:complete len:165 (-) Transcript_45828:316-810(-)|eukprot:CAMPEP_0185574868 /NCGR_PEP_ID=MMETSP0434-20130131/6220_1 /TAXON_ID=626734 ORGANISM="Favella taraikaensis, Strain Fe Narragansett Bay" /NCGR_SAMPLE_ID=MMETSP0434 /ASSEMBLY_ACC=CAM_ASM_000379 /LENGTH=164 /DNA_ID=CAMNT_0028191577 /DNA_START=342 /DNA_END=836 /DNA_ORIENTATION=+